MLDHRKSCVYVIDDDEILARSICFLIKSTGYDVKVLNSPEFFLQVYDPKKISCLILDVRMPYMSGLELQLNLIKKEIKIPIIFVSGYGDIPMAIDALKKGACDFLTKPLNNQELLDSVNKALRNERKRSEDESKRLRSKRLYAQLTPREKEILRCVVSGNSTKQIAKLLLISPHTVDVHRANIFKKMGVSCVTELILLFT